MLDGDDPNSGVDGVPNPVSPTQFGLSSLPHWIMVLIKSIHVVCSMLRERKRSGLFTPEELEKTGKTETKRRYRYPLNSQLHGNHPAEVERIHQPIWQNLNPPLAILFLILTKGLVFQAIRMMRLFNFTITQLIFKSDNIATL
jgi:hypothetical protein